MRRICLAIVTALALALPAAAGADSGLIAVGRSIGPVSLGMAREQVIATIGQPSRVDRFAWPSGQSGSFASTTPAPVVSAKVLSSTRPPPARSRQP